MHWLHSDYLPEKSGVVTQFLFNRHGKLVVTHVEIFPANRRLDGAIAWTPIHTTTASCLTAQESALRTQISSVSPKHHH